MVLFNNMLPIRLLAKPQTREEQAVLAFWVSLPENSINVLVTMFLTVPYCVEQLMGCLLNLLLISRENIPHRKKQKSDPHEGGSGQQAA